METKINNVVIKSIHKKDGPKIIKYFKSLGCNTGGYSGECYENNVNDYYMQTHCYYGVINGHFMNYNYSDVINHNVKIIELPNTNYPKKMITWQNCEEYSLTHEVVGEIILPVYGKVYIAKNHSCDTELFVALHAKDIFTESKPEELVLTIEDIANKFGCDPKLLRIIDK